MLSFLLIGIFTGSVYALLAVAFVMVYKGTRVFNLALGEIGGFGLYVASALVAAHVPILAAALVGIAASTVLGLALERTLIRPLIDRTPLAAMASTLGAGLVIAYIEALAWGYNIKTFPSPFGRRSFNVGTLVVTTPQIVAVLAGGIVAVGLGIFLRRTRFGLAVWAATSNQVLARLSGVAVGRARAFVWALGGALAGLAAILIGVLYTFHPLSNTLLLVPALAAALLGGLTSIPGAFAGGIAVGVVESLTRWQSSVGGASDAAIVLLILVLLLVRPGGIGGVAET